MVTITGWDPEKKYGRERCGRNLSGGTGRLSAQPIAPRRPVHDDMVFSAGWDGARAV